VQSAAADTSIKFSPAFGHPFQDRILGAEGPPLSHAGNRGKAAGSRGKATGGRGKVAGSRGKASGSRGKAVGSRGRH
jgi:hypothetical protein